MTHLHKIAEGHTRRMALRRRMLDHVGIILTEEMADPLRDEIRDSVMACVGCKNADVCEGYLDRDYTGLPMFCSARYAFQNLSAAVQQHRQAIAAE